jgi:hypothetical protein
MRRALLAISCTAAILIACGSRGPLDDTGAGVASQDASADALANVDAQSLVDAAVPVEAGPLQCAGCVLTTCGQSIVSCLGDSACLGVFQCITTTCLGLGAVTDAGRRDGGGGGGGGLGGLLGGGGSGLNVSCLLGCAGKNPAGAIAVLGIFSCVTGTCGGQCGSLLGGLGNLGGLGALGGLLGGGSSSGGKGLPAFDDNEEVEGPIDRDTLEQVLSPWPELMSRDDRAH